MSDLLRRSLGEQIAIETVLAGGLWRVHVDPNQLEVAILNLAVNARDAMPDGGKLTIETANAHLDESYAATQAEVLPGQYVVICVTDTGSGMTPRGARHAPSSRSSRPRMSGTAPGSACPRSTASSSSRAATSRSTPRSDEGTTVKIYLPRLHAAAEDEAGAGARMTAAAQRRRPRRSWWSRTTRTCAATRTEILRELGYRTLEAAHRPRGAADCCAHIPRSSCCSPTSACPAA